MSVYFYIFNKETKECLCLGKRHHRDGHEYQGPAVFIDGDNYFLPASYLDLLIQRFKEKADNDSVIVLPDYELFDTEDYVSESEVLIKIGGEGHGDLPITKYFPELESDSVKEEIKRTGKIIK